MPTPRKKASARKVRISTRDELILLRHQIEKLQTTVNELKKSIADLDRGHTMSLRRFGELQLDLDRLKKVLERPTFPDSR